ncbi:MAG TPA: hypothetical protein VM871_02450 [Flavisolibacter sp.]|jgi:hypothetical protein|nr:hypothetical protein [Flavisolibacter sp.]
MSNYPKLKIKMNGYLYTFFNYFEVALQPAAGKNEMPKNKRRTLTASVRQASPDSLNIRAAQRAQNTVRRNPAP